MWLELHHAPRALACRSSKVFTKLPFMSKIHCPDQRRAFIVLAPSLHARNDVDLITDDVDAMGANQQNVGSVTSRS